MVSAGSTMNTKRKAIMDDLHGRDKFSAFTLIELLVVIAIISLLVSILLPSLNKAKDLARKVACMSNFRNIGCGVNMYALDGDGRVPPAVTWWADAGIAADDIFTNKWSLPFLISEYVFGATTTTTPTSGANPFLCPALRGPYEGYRPYGTSTNYNGTYAREVLLNGGTWWSEVASNDTTEGRVRGKDIASAYQPSLAAVADDRGTGYHCEVDFSTYDIPNGNPIVAVYLDGHAIDICTGAPGGMLSFYSSCDAEWMGWLESFSARLYPAYP